MRGDAFFSLSLHKYKNRIVCVCYKDKDKK